MKTATNPEHKLRVLMLIENLSFPMDRRMRQEAFALQREGYQVIVICPRGRKLDRSAFDVVESVLVYRYPLYWQGGGGLGYLVEYSWAMLCTLSLMLLVWMRHGFDIIHAANPPDLFSVVSTPFRWLGKKFVYDQHDLCPETYEAKFDRKDWIYKLLCILEQYTYRSADLVIATNQSFYDIARIRGGVPERKLTIVRSGPDLKDFQRREPQTELKRGRDYMVAYLGVMGKQDGVENVVRAAHHITVTKQRRDVVFTLIGDGDCREELEEMAADLGINGCIQFTGRIPDEDLLSYLSTADVCVAPDPPIPLNQMSTMNKMMEYMACGKPIVSFDLLESRRSADAAAVYVQGQDAVVLAEAVDNLLSDPVRRENMGRFGFERVRSHLDWKNSERSLLRAYSVLLGQE